MMNDHIPVLSKWGQFLYRTGLKSQYIAAHGTPGDLRRLDMACRNAELLLRMQEENKRLFAAVSGKSLSAHSWQEFTKLKKRMYQTLQKFIQDANLYEWPTLVTAFIPTDAIPADKMLDISAVPSAEDLLKEVGHGE